MKVAILESIVMPAGHEVEFDRILIEGLKTQGYDPLFFVPEKFPFKFDYKTEVEYLAGGEVVSYAGAGNWKKYGGRFYVKNAVLLGLMMLIKKLCKASVT